MKGKPLGPGGYRYFEERFFASTVYKEGAKRRYMG
jgi:hypothetical protein